MIDSENLEDFSSYELAFILKGKEDVELIKKLLVKHGVEIQFYKEPINIKLAYLIQGQTSGFFGFYNLVVKKDKVAELRHDLRLLPNVLRFLILKFSSEKMQKNKKTYNFATGDNLVSVDSTSHPRPSLTNEALEAKIQEMLK